MSEITVIRPASEHWDAILDVLRTANLHAIGGEEMPAFPLGDCFIALCDARVVGVAGYRVVDERSAKNTLLAVDPDFRRKGIGWQLCQARITHFHSLGVCTVYTNCDDPDVICWQRKFGFSPTGKTTPKVEDYGRRDKDRWVELVANISE